MAINNRSTNQVTIDTNLPDNITELITPEKHREVETDLNDSTFNQIDEPRDVIKSTAFVNSANGNDLTGKVGDMSQPFATIQAGVDASADNGGVVIVLGGSYTENVQIIKDNFVIKAYGIVLSGSIWFRDCTDAGGDFTGSEITASLQTFPALRFTGTAGNKKTVRGGKWICNIGAGEAVTGNDAFIIGAQFVATSTSYTIKQLTNSRVILCEATSTGGPSLSSGTIFRCSNTFFAFSSFIDTLAGRHAYTTQAFNTFYDCKLQSDGDTIRGESFSGLQGKFVDCDIISDSDSGANLVGATRQFKIKGGEIKAGLHGLDLTGLASNTTRPAGVTNIIEGVDIYAGSGNPIEEPVSYAAGDMGVLLSINNVYNKTQPAVSVKVIESNPTTYVGLEEI